MCNSNSYLLLLLTTESNSLSILRNWRSNDWTRRTKKEQKRFIKKKEKNNSFFNFFSEGSRFEESQQQQQRVISFSAYIFSSSTLLLVGAARLSTQFHNHCSCGSWRRVAVVYVGDSIQLTFLRVWLWRLCSRKTYFKRRIHDFMLHMAGSQVERAGRNKRCLVSLQPGHDRIKRHKAPFRETPHCPNEHHRFWWYYRIPRRDIGHGKLLVNTNIIPTLAVDRLFYPLQMLSLFSENILIWRVFLLTLTPH